MILVVSMLTATLAGCGGSSVSSNSCLLYTSICFYDYNMLRRAAQQIPPGARCAASVLFIGHSPLQCRPSSRREVHKVMTPG